MRVLSGPLILMQGSTLLCAISHKPSYAEKALAHLFFIVECRVDVDQIADFMISIAKLTIFKYLITFLYSTPRNVFLANPIRVFSASKTTYAAFSAMSPMMLRSESELDCNPPKHWELPALGPAKGAKFM